MAPDLNTVSAGKRVDYSQPGSSGYDIDSNVTYLDPQNRKLRVLTIGGGITGILMAYQIQKHCENVEHVVYEKNEDIGGGLCNDLLFLAACANQSSGTWLENRYPGEDDSRLRWGTSDPSPLIVGRVCL